MTHILFHLRNTTEERIKKHNQNKSGKLSAQEYKIYHIQIQHSKCYSNNNSKFIPADKSNASVIITNEQLHNKIQLYLDNNQILKTTDNAKTYNAEIQNFLNNNCIILPEKTKFIYYANT